jgi:hypothetical protein
MLPMRAVRWLIVVLSVAMYVSSLMLPALRLRFHTVVSLDQPSEPAINAAPTYPPVLTPPPPPPPPSAPRPDPLISHDGWKMLLVSVFGPLEFNFAGLANLFLPLGCIAFLLRRDRTAAILLGVALLFAMQTFQLIYSGIEEGESGDFQSYLVHPLLGWYLWVGAMLLPLAAALYFRRKSAAPPATNAPAVSG